MDGNMWAGKCDPAYPHLTNLGNISFKLKIYIYLNSAYLHLTNLGIVLILFNGK